MERGLNRIKIRYNPEKNKHEIYGWGYYFYPSSSEKTFEDWGKLFSIEDVDDWEEQLIDVIKRWIKKDKDGTCE